MKKAVVIDPEVLYEIDNDSFNVVLEKLGEKESNWDMVGFKEKIERLKWVKKKQIEKAVGEHVEERLHRDARFVLDQIKGKGYKIFLVNSNPTVLYDLMKEKLPIDKVFGSELVFDKEACLGEYLSLYFDSIFLGNLKNKLNWIINFDGQPNRYGLALSLYKYMEENDIDMEKSFIVSKKATSVPIAEFVGKLVAIKGNEDMKKIADVHITEISELLTLL